MCAANVPIVNHHMSARYCSFPRILCFRSKEIRARNRGRERERERPREGVTNGREGERETERVASPPPPSSARLHEHLQFLFNYEAPDCFSQRVAHLRRAKWGVVHPFPPGYRNFPCSPAPPSSFSISDVEVLMNWKKEFTKPRD